MATMNRPNMRFPVQGAPGQQPQGRPQAPQVQPQAQGRAVTTQGGQPGVVGRGGNFQPLGPAALRGLPNGAGAGGLPPGVPGMLGRTPPIMDPRMQPGVAFGNSGMGEGGSGNPGAPGTPGPGDIQSAIGSLRAQLGVRAMSPGGPGGMGMQEAPGVAPPMPMPGQGSGQPPPGALFGAAREQLQAQWPGGPGGPGGPQGAGNPYVDLLKKRAMAGGGLGGVAAGGPNTY